MTISINLVPIVVAVLGAVVYLVVTPSKPAELGKIAFFAGLLAALMLHGHC